MRTYGMAYHQVMELPVRAFWFISGVVGRLRADEAKLQLEVAAVAAGGHEAVQALLERLNAEAPEPVALSGYALAQRNAVLDETGLQELKAMAG